METNNERILFDSHMHTPLCKHAQGEPNEYAQVGWEKGLRGVIFTCHSPMPGNFAPEVRMGMEEFPAYVHWILSTAEHWRRHTDEFSVLLGMESDWFPGMEKWLEELHSRAPFDYILGSIHPFLPEYRQRFFQGDELAFQKQYFSHLADAAETGLFQCLSHPDIVKTMYKDSWNFDLLAEHLDLQLQRIAKTGIAMELNTSGLLKRYPEMNPGKKMLAMMKAHNIPVVLGSDSHVPSRVSADFITALQDLKKVGYESVRCFQAQSPMSISIDDGLKSLLPYA